MSMLALHAIEPTILVASEAGALEAWQIGAVAFAFVGLVLIVTFLLERWEVGLHA